MKTVIRCTPMIGQSLQLNLYNQNINKMNDIKVLAKRVEPMTRAKAVQEQRGTIFECSLPGDTFKWHLMRTDSYLDDYAFINIATGGLCPGGDNLNYYIIYNVDITPI